jgi:hypothetical protein
MVHRCLEDRDASYAPELEADRERVVDRALDGAHGLIDESLSSRCARFLTLSSTT